MEKMKMESRKPLNVLVVDDGLQNELTFKEIIGKELRKKYPNSHISTFVPDHYNKGKENITDKEVIEHLEKNKYNIIICDMSFATSKPHTKQEMQKLAEKPEAHKIYDCFKNNYPENRTRGWGTFHDRISFLIKRCEISQDKGIDMMMGGIKVGKYLKEKGQKFTFYTGTWGHAIYSSFMALLEDLIKPEDFVSCANNKVEIESLGPLYISHRGNFIAGTKGFRFDKDWDYTENWVKALETAIKYQSK